MEQKEKSSVRKSLLCIKIIFWVFVSIWTGISIWLLIDSKEDYSFFNQNSQSFHQGWVLSEDTNTPVTVPGKIGGEETEVRIQNTIPEGIDDRTTIMISGLHQSIVVRIDGNVVGKLDNSETRRFGLHTPSGYVMVPLNSGDKGKTIEITYSAPEPEVAGQISEIRIGTEMGLLFWLIQTYGSDVIFAILLLYTGLVIALFGLVLRFGSQENPNMNIIYLGITAVCTAIWMLGESGLKQFYYGDLGTGEIIFWEALFLSPIPLLFYVNRLQDRRYTKIYVTGVALGLTMNLVMVILEFVNVYDFFDMYKIGWVIIVGSGLLIIYTIICDWLHGIHHWRLLVGILLIMVCIFLQMWSFANSTTILISRNFISLGLILFMIIMGISAITSMLKQKQEQELAIKANETKSDFLANMSHEIRTPINAMLGFDEMILREETDERIIDYATNIKKAGANLLSLINDILDFSKVESGKMEIIEEEYKTSSMLTDVINMTNVKAQEKGLSFDIFIGKDIPRKLYGDELRVKQILTNVLNNAVKYTESGSVTLSVNYDKLGGNKGRLRISVADTGMGIEPENISKITESFQRFDLQRNRSIEGTGLGMSIVAGLIKRMGGKLQIYSTYGKGSDFRILIPQEIRDETPIGNYQNDYRKDLRSQAPYRELFTAPQARILFVDDNIMNLSVAKGLLKKTKIQIDTADSGVGCLDLTRQNKYDLIFMDHLMPEMDGVETLRRLRREEGNPNQYTIVIALTANAIKGSKEFYLQEGFHEYLTKPIEGEKLEQVLLQLLPKEYIIPAEEDVQTVIDRLEQDESGGKRKEEKNVTADDCMHELADLLKQAHIQVEEGYHFAGNSMGQFHWMIMLFAQSFGEKYRKLSQFYEEKNVEMYTIEVHALKSNAKGIGAKQLNQLAWEHEQQSRAGNWSYVQSHWEELCLEWSCVVNGILNYIGEDTMELNEVAVAVEENPSDLTAEQRMVIENSISFVEDFEADPACAMLGNLLKEEISEENRRNLVQVIEALDHLDYETARMILKRL